MPCSILRDTWLRRIRGAKVSRDTCAARSSPSAPAEARRETDVSGVGFGGELGWTFQAFDLPNRELTAPFRVTEL